MRFASWLVIAPAFGTIELRSFPSVSRPRGTKQERFEFFLRLPYCLPPGLYRWRIHRLRAKKSVCGTLWKQFGDDFTALSDGSATFVNKRWSEYSGLSVEDFRLRLATCDPS
jgi:hypothetical protein